MFVLLVLSLMVAAGSLLVAYSALRNSKKQQERERIMEAVEGEIDKLSEKVEGRFNVIDEKLNHTATKEDILGLENRLKEYMKQEFGPGNKPSPKGR